MEATLSLSRDRQITNKLNLLHIQRGYKCKTEEYIQHNTSPGESISVRDEIKHFLIKPQTTAEMRRKKNVKKERKKLKDYHENFRTQEIIFVVFLS